MITDPVATARDGWRTRYDPWLASRRYHPVLVASDSIVYRRQYIPGFCVVLAVLLFPIGLFALLVRSSALLTVQFAQRDERSTHVQINGRGGRETARAIHELAGEFNLVAERGGDR